MSPPSSAAGARLWASPQAAAVLLVAAAAWAATIVRAIDMGNMSGTMGLALGAFLVLWGLMMAAMMLPAVAPVASLYIRTFADGPWRRTAMLVAGYLLTWVAVGVPVYVLARLVDHVDEGTFGARVVIAAIFASAGIWQLTGAKDTCLRHCRSPLALLFHYGGYTGRSRDLRVGVHHGAWCIGCCWALMVLLLAFGLMNVWAMIGLAALILAEKRWSAGEQLARLVGVALIVWAVAMLFFPGLAPAFGGSSMSM
jgi:predicted metal-binding membrane protein